MSMDARMLPKETIIHWAALELQEAAAIGLHRLNLFEMYKDRRQFVAQCIYHHKVAREQLRQAGYITTM